ncbi:MAG: hypothetical protein KGH72_05970 [Candidatus Micrarchaeota archaeon]|nr:hypothetical protein [Candidatus Micrarchaeota archaeon]
MANRVRTDRLESSTKILAGTFGEDMARNMSEVMRDLRAMRGFEINDSIVNTFARMVASRYRNMPAVAESLFYVLDEHTSGLNAINMDDAMFRGYMRTVTSADFVQTLSRFADDQHVLEMLAEAMLSRAVKAEAWDGREDGIALRNMLLAFEDERVLSVLGRFRDSDSRAYVVNILMEAAFKGTPVAQKAGEIVLAIGDSSNTLRTIDFRAGQLASSIQKDLQRQGDLEESVRA